MNAEALALVVTGALLHAFWNYYAKKASGGLPFVWLFGVVSLAVSLPFGIAAWIRNTVPLGAVAWAAIAASAIIHILYALVLQKGYQKSDFSIVYPLARGTGPLFAVVGAVILLNEAPSLLGWLGIAAVLSGIFLVAGISRILAPAPKMVAGLFWGCLTGVCIASYTVIDGWAVKGLGLAPLLYYVSGLALRTVLLAPLALADRPALRAQWRANRRCVLVVGICSPLAYTLVLYAMTLAPLSYVAPVRELSMLIGVFIGAKLLREAFTPSRAVGTALMVAGVVALALAR